MGRNWAKDKIWRTRYYAMKYEEWHPGSGLPLEEKGRLGQNEYQRRRRVIRREAMLPEQLEYNIRKSREYRNKAHRERLARMLPEQKKAYYKKRYEMYEKPQRERKKQQRLREEKKL